MNCGVMAEDKAHECGEGSSDMSSVDSVYCSITSVSLTVTRLALH